MTLILPPLRPTPRQWELWHVRHFAEDAHARVVNPDGSIGHKRKFTNEPYIVHPIAVMGLVATTPGCTKEQLAVALLHDVVEDTGVQLDEIERRFGGLVAEDVDWLTDPDTVEGNRQARETAKRQRLALAPARVQTVKVADAFHNGCSVLALAPSYARTYLPERLALVHALTLADPGLRQMAIGSMEASIALMNTQTERDDGNTNHTTQRSRGNRP